jgi:glycosyltransferase involved in cell wall biosynthesis
MGMNAPHPVNHAQRPRVAFVSTMEGCPWGGSEWLWHSAALLLREAGCAVAVSVPRWDPVPDPVAELRNAGCAVRLRPRREGMRRQILRRLSRIGGSADPGRVDADWLRHTKPDLVVISQGYPLEGIGWMRECVRRGIRYTTIVQAAGELWWPEDELLEDMQSAYRNAEAVFFVSDANRRVVEWQCGAKMENAEPISNPWHRSVGGDVPWPEDDGTLRIACVGRLDPRAKGQDLVLRMLALPAWQGRALTVRFHGSGPCRESLKAMSAMLGATNASFAGESSDITTLWAAHHALLLPSRYEGAPLVIHEAMLCARPVITTDVAGNTDLLADGINGFVIPAPTLPLLAQTMERAWQRRDAWREMGRRARETALTSLPPRPAADLAKRLIGLSGNQSPS